MDGDVHALPMPSQGLARLAQGLVAPTCPEWRLPEPRGDGRPAPPSFLTGAERRMSIRTVAWGPSRILKLYAGIFFLSGCSLAVKQYPMGVFQTALRLVIGTFVLLLLN